MKISSSSLKFDQKKVAEITDAMYLVFVQNVVNSDNPADFIEQAAKRIEEGNSNKSLFDRALSDIFFSGNKIIQDDVFYYSEYIRTGNNERNLIINEEMLNYVLAYDSFYELLIKLRAQFRKNPNYDPRNLSESRELKRSMTIDPESTQEWFEGFTQLCYSALLILFESLRNSHPNLIATIQREQSVFSRLFSENQNPDSLRALEQKLQYLESFKDIQIAQLYDVAQLYLNLGLLPFFTSLKENDRQYVCLTMAIEKYLIFLNTQLMPTSTSIDDTATVKDNILIKLKPGFGKKELGYLWKRLEEHQYVEGDFDAFQSLFIQTKMVTTPMIWKHRQVTFFFLFYSIYENCTLKKQDPGKILRNISERFTSEKGKKFKDYLVYIPPFKSYFDSKSTIIDKNLPKEPERSELVSLITRSFSL